MPGTAVITYEAQGVGDDLGDAGRLGAAHFHNYGDAHSPRSSRLWLRGQDAGQFA
jgi:hypothetical protein